MTIPQEVKKLSPSRMAMWRSFVALAYADGVLEAHEKSMLLDYISANHFDPAFAAQLEADISNATPLKDVYPAVTEVKDRADLLNLGRVLFYADGDFAASEQRVYDEIHKDLERAADFPAVEAAARKDAEKVELEESVRKAEADASEGPIVRVIRWVSEIPDYFFGSGSDVEE